MFFSHGRLAFLRKLDFKFVNWWVWLESFICLGWLKNHLLEQFGAQQHQGTEIRVCLGYVKNTSRKTWGPKEYVYTYLTYVQADECVSLMRNA